jgi:hypothetical protein
MAFVDLVKTSNSELNYQGRSLVQIATVSEGKLAKSAVATSSSRILS